MKSLSAPSLMDRANHLLLFLLTNFGPLIGFYFVNHFWGFQAGLIVSMLLVFLEFFLLKYKRTQISPFFYFTSAIILVFGVIDLTIQDPILIKYEATATNLIFAIFFGLSIFKEKSIVQEIAESQKRTSTESNPDKVFFFQVFTIFWAFYFLIKAVYYFWLNSNTSLEEALILRMIIGKVSFWVMMFISVVIPRKIWKAMEFFKVFPSQRKDLLRQS